jgi:hypothetical protein
MQATAVLAAIFAVICFCVVVTGLTSLDAGADAAQVADTKGFAIFWGFLGAIGVAVALAGWRIAKTVHPND